MQIEDPPWVSHVLFESPWVLMVVLAVVGLALWWRRKRGWGLVMIALAGASWGLAWVVETDREAVMAATRELVAAAGPLDLERLDGWVDPDAVITSPGWPAEVRWDAARATLARAAERFGLEEQKLRGLQAAVRGEATAVSAIDLRTAFASGPGAGLPVPSLWLLTWAKGADGRWRMVEARWVRLRGEEPRRGVVDF